LVTYLVARVELGPLKASVVNPVVTALADKTAFVVAISPNPEALGRPRAPAYVALVAGLVHPPEGRGR
jgi:hypothetical protein